MTSKQYEELTEYYREKSVEAEKKRDVGLQDGGWDAYDLANNNMRYANKLYVKYKKCAEIQRSRGM